MGFTQFLSEGRRTKPIGEQYKWIKERQAPPDQRQEQLSQ